MLRYKFILEKARLDNELLEIKFSTPTLCLPQLLYTSGLPRADFVNFKPLPQFGQTLGLQANAVRNFDSMASLSQFSFR